MPYFTIAFEKFIPDSKVIFEKIRCFIFINYRLKIYSTSPVFLETNSFSSNVSQMIQILWTLITKRGKNVRHFPPSLLKLVCISYAKLFSFTRLLLYLIFKKGLPYIQSMSLRNREKHLKKFWFAKSFN